MRWLRALFHQPEIEMKKQSKYFYRYRSADTGYFMTEAQALKRDRRTWIRSRHVRKAK